MEWLKTKGLTAIMLIIFLMSVSFGLLANIERYGTFTIVIVCLCLSVSGTYLVEKFVFPGWNINDEIKKGKEGSQNAGMVYIAIAIVISSIISKLF